MTDAQTILKMIEEVDPADSDKLDEIDARVWFFIHHPNVDLSQYKNLAQALHDIEREYKITPFACGIKRYTRSRDALKGIRPDDYYPELYAGPKGAFAQLCIPFDSEKYGRRFGTCFDSGLMPNEELAELHAIIQAIEYERNK